MSSASTAAGRRRSALPGVALAATGALLMSSCTVLPLPGLPAATPTTQAPSQTAEARSTETAAVVWEKPLSAIGQPVVQDGVALVYAKASAGVEAHAYSVKDGKELWTQPVHPGFDSPAEPLEPAVTRTASGKSAAIFLQAATAPANASGTDWWTSPVAVDLTTGKEIYRGRPELVSTRPFACDDIEDMCFIAYDETATTLEHWVDLDAGEEFAGPDVNPLNGNFRPVGKELYSTEEGGVEKLAHVAYGEVLWEVDLETVFGKGATTDMGGHFAYSEKLDLYVGSVGYSPASGNSSDLSGTSMALNLRDINKTVGFRASSGRVLWVSEGSQIMCAQTMGTEATKLQGGEALPVRCEYTEGTVEYPSGKYVGSKGKLAGYDPLTGLTVWETKPVEVTWYRQAFLPAANHGEAVIAGTFWDSNMVDTRTGKYKSSTTFEDVFVCLEETTYALPPGGPYKDFGGTGAGSVTAFPCTKGGTPVPSFTYGALTDVDTMDDGIAVISLEGKVAGYRLLKDFT
ncbi:PQQ-binding-like beta-propeller repeat protein [Paenarthrobacter sp. NPDC058040]|uniref:outer membrane protein assembly factor BamB family protein n=1 Tax=unclassified Paenarthrobacter TaxID=2634190 RepID=UPI0036DC85A3